MNTLRHCPEIVQTSTRVSAAEFWQRPRKMKNDKKLSLDREQREATTYYLLVCHPRRVIGYQSCQKRLNLRRVVSEPFRQEWPIQRRGETSDDHVRIWFRLVEKASAKRPSLQTCRCVLGLGHDSTEGADGVSKVEA